MIGKMVKYLTYYGWVTRVRLMIMIRVRVSIRAKVRVNEIRILESYIS